VPDKADESIDQAAIDALLDGGAGAASNAEDAVAPRVSEGGTRADSGTGQNVRQDDIDALLGAASNAEAPAGGETSEGHSRAAEPAGPGEATSDAISQADIDALLGAVGGDGTGASAGVPGTPAEPGTRVDSLGRPFDDAAAAMQAAIEEETAGAAAAQAAATAGPAPGAAPNPGTAPYVLPELVLPEGLNIDPKRVSMLNDVNLRVKIELGRTRMLVEDVLALGEGSVVELDKLAGDPVDVYVNERLVARGEVLVLNDNFCVRVSEVLSNDPHRVSV
jgi:flagellar motor switch protein FliN/FliY